jgi:hypothetical protein
MYASLCRCMTRSPYLSISGYNSKACQLWHLQSSSIPIHQHAARRAGHTPAIHAALMEPQTFAGANLTRQVNGRRETTFIEQACLLKRI